MTVSVGEQIQAGTGQWDGNPTGYSYQWQDSLNGTVLNADIAGETRSDLIVSSDELGRWLRAEVFASNAGGFSDAAYSSWYGPVQGAPEVADGSRKRNRRAGGGSKPHGRIRRTV